MTKIALFHEPFYAPGCYIIARQLGDGTYNPYSEDDTILVQTDTDFPGVARTFGAEVEDDAVDRARAALDAMSYDARFTRLTRFTQDAALEVEDPGYFPQPAPITSDRKRIDGRRS